jgi:hypothetical protein
VRQLLSYQSPWSEVIDKIGCRHLSSTKDQLVELLQKIEDRQYCFWRVMFPSLGKSTKYKSFCAREKLFRVGIRKEEEEFYSDQIHAASDQSFCAVHPSTENHIQKKLSAVPTRGHTGASSGEGMSTA